MQVLCACEFILVEIPIIVLSIGTLSTDSGSGFSKVDTIWQLVEVPVYTAVGMILSGIYIYHAISLSLSRR